MKNSKKIKILNFVKGLLNYKDPSTPIILQESKILTAECKFELPVTIFDDMKPHTLNKLITEEMIEAVINVDCIHLKVEPAPPEMNYKDKVVIIHASIKFLK